MAPSGDPTTRDDLLVLLEAPSRAAVAGRAATAVEPGVTLGLGSGRAVWATLELLGRRAELAGTPVVTASTTTERLAAQLGFEVVTLDGAVRVDLLIDGADEVAPDLGLIKGHGAALLREKLVAVAARRFVVVAEAAKRVRHLGEQRSLPVEVVRFAWADTRRRLLADLADVAVDIELRTSDGGDALITDEGHHLLHVELVRGGTDVRALATQLSTTVGVVEHGLFLDLADEVLLGSDDGGVEVLRR